MTQKAHMKVSIRTFSANLMDGLEKRIALFQSDIKEEYKGQELPVLSRVEWMEKYRNWSEGNNETDLNVLIKAFLSAGEE